MAALLTIVLTIGLLAGYHARSFNDFVSMERKISDLENGLNPRVIGGRQAEDQEFPWMVSLHYQGRFICSSFLITPSVLMTAAHCVVFGEEAESPQKYNAYAGTVNRDGPNQEMLFTDIIAHKDYGSGTEYDIALMKLKTPMTLSSGIQTVCLPQKGSKFENQIAQAMGWGVTAKGGRESSEMLMTVPQDVPTNSLCQFVYALLQIPVTQRHVCAGGGDSGICFGDSGGPLVFLNSTQPIAIGVASFVSALGCASPWIPGVYTATESYLDWVQENMGDETSDLCIL